MLIEAGFPYFTGPWEQGSTDVTKSHRFHMQPTVDATINEDTPQKLRGNPCYFLF